MATIVTRAAKGSPLTHNEVDANFTNLNTDKAETSALAAVATSGSYNDLSNTPAPFDPNTLATVATTGAYSDLTGKPTLGTAAATDTTAYATAAQGALADSALQGNQTITFSGDATGSGTTSIVVTVVDDSHNHIISNVDGLQTALDGKQPTGAYLTGNQTITLSGDLSGSGTTSINAQIAANVVNANELNVVGNGTATQFLRSDADGSFTWAVPTDTNTTYTAGTGLALTGTVFSNTITNNNQLTNGAGYITSDTTKLPLAGGAMTGPITTNSTFDGRDVSVDGAKLDGIAAGANNYSFPYTVSAVEGINTVAQRSSGGYLHASYFNGTGSFATSGAASGMSTFTGGNGSDTYARPFSAAAARTLLNVADGATNVTNTNQLTNGSGYITSSASISGNAATATILQTTRAINGVNFNGSGNITVEAYIENDESTNATRYLTFVDNTTASFKRLNEDSTLYYNPSSNTLSAGNFNTTSDIRLKDNIRTFESAMDVVSQLRGVRFAWKETGVETVGLIAQEVEKVLPELIGTNADTGLKSVSYANMVAVLIEAVKELKAEIEELKKR
mgnify:CR=1 FL=1